MSIYENEEILTIFYIVVLGLKYVIFTMCVVTLPILNYC